MLRPVEVDSFGVDPSTNAPVIILIEKNGTRKLAVTVGPAEVSAIAMKSLNVETEKPMTSDLIVDIVNRLGGKLDKIAFYDAQDNTLLTRIYINQGTSAFMFDCRSADALALALRSNVPIFVEDSIFERLVPANISEKDKLKQMIRTLDTLEFGRYYLE